MNQSDVEAIAKKLCEDLYHPKNADCREEAIKRMKDNPECAVSLVLRAIDDHGMRKAMSKPGVGVVMISDASSMCTAVTKRLVEMAEARAIA